MKKEILSSILLILFGFMIGKDALSWDDGVTHKDLSRYAVESSVLDKSTSDYLKNLGFNKGLDMEYLEWNGYKTLSIKDWIAEGAELEDAGTKWEALTGVARFNNHFHNPRKLWIYAGLDDTVLGLHYTGESAVIWAQDFNGQQNAVGGNWSWQRIRQSYFDALTAQTEEDRQTSFAVTFSGLGNQMHLIEDMGQPDHVRNDAHPEDAMFGKNILNGSRYIETWAKTRFRNLNELKAFAPNPILPGVSFISDDGYIPISRLIDTKQYYNGGVPSTSLSQGLAEYTNANFFSNDTLFAAERYTSGDGHYFSFPRRASTDLQNYLSGSKTSEIIIADDGTPDKGMWISKTFDGEFIQHAARTSFITKYTYNIFGEGNLFYSTFYLDDKCHEDYSQNLIPRAVGYSAGLLNYFFRGTLEITPPAQVAYAVTDGSLTPYVDSYGNYHQQFRSIKAKIRNSTPDTIPGEEIQAGILQAVARYKIIPNYMYDLSNYPPDGSVMHNLEYSYSVSSPITITSLSSTAPTEFTFDFSGSPIPAGITDLYLQVIFKGTLGSETDIAVAVGMRDLMEPTHQVFWNLTDMYSLDHHLYTSDTIKNTPALADRVDFNGNGVFNETGEPYIDPYPMTFGIGYQSGPPEQGGTFYYSAITTVQPGEHIRLIVLMDKPQDNYLVLEESDAVSDTAYFYFTSPGVVNQEVDGTWQALTPVVTFRYGLDGVTQIPIRQHYETGVIRCYPVDVNPDGNPACYYSESEAIPGELLPLPIDTVYFP